MVIRLNEQDESPWEELISKNFVIPQQSIEIKKIIHQTYPHCKSAYFLNNKHDAGYPFFLINSKIFGNRVISLPFFDVGGFLGKVEKKDIKEIINYFKRYKDIKNIEIKLNNFMPSFIEHKNLLEKNGFFIDKIKRQYIINLTNEQEMWNRFHKHTRNDIRKAEKSGLIIKKINQTKELKEYYNLYLTTMKNFGTPQHSFKYFDNCMNIMKEEFIGLNCYLDKKLVASLIGLYKKEYLYVAFNISNPRYREYRPNDLLYWEIIKLALSKKIKIMDLGQIDIDAKPGSHAEGLFKFKNKWLGKIYFKYYFVYSFEKSILFKELKENKYKKLRRLWKKLPLCFVKKIGPKICSQLGI